MTSLPRDTIRDSPTARGLKRDVRYYEIKREIEEFLYDESAMLDERRFGDWLDTLEEDVLYFMPMMFNVKYGRHAEGEMTREEKEMSWFNEGKWTLSKRVEQILTGVHWAEEPLSRLCRLVTNVQLTAIGRNAAGQDEVKVSSGFLLYQNRCEHEQYYFAGKRHDVLRRKDDRWKLARREIRLGQSVLLAKNLTMFF